MLIKVLKRSGDASNPNEIEMETVLHIGDKFLMAYDWCKRIPCINGYKPDWYKGIAEFTVVDIVCNMLYKPESVWIRLHSDDELFNKRCGSGDFDVEEDKVLESIKVAKKAA
ncbi:MAG: hypothetical protein KIG65_00895 [Eubacteriales bacterium]|nr:hypothetical protein [Eubacteriales bacterium]